MSARLTLDMSIIGHDSYIITCYNIVIYIVIFFLYMIFFVKCIEYNVVVYNIDAFHVYKIDITFCFKCLIDGHYIYSLFI